MQILQGADLTGADQLAGAGDGRPSVIGVGVQIAEDGSILVRAAEHAGNRTGVYTVTILGKGLFTRTINVTGFM